MRNFISELIALSLLACVAGCNSDNNARQNLNAGYTALEQRQYDQAMARADQHLRQTPAGPGSAEALYLRGRALEQKTAANPAQSRQNFLQARDAYNQALALAPGEPLEGRIHAGLANTSYWLDDYPSAQQQWTAAYESLDDPAAKSFALYRIGLCQQRLEQFAQADQTFGKVQQGFPNSDSAKRAREHQGFRSFTVQLATFANGRTAESAANSLRKQGIVVGKSVNPQGQTVLSLPPVPTYAQAEAIRGRYASIYPQAVIVP
jgi:tetratricopeptide (TPR) repeat protein